MSQTAMEVAVMDIGNHKVEDESTEAGKSWRTVWSKITKVNGYLQGAWGRSVTQPNIMTFCIDWQTYYDHEQLMDHSVGKGRTLGPAIMDILEDRPFDMYHIHPNNESRAVIRAPYTKLFFFWGIDESKFFAADMWAEFSKSIEKSDSCIGFLWGECRSPPRQDPSGNMALGKGGILISGWASKEDYERDIALPRVKNAFQRVSTAAKKAYSYGVVFRVVTKGGDELSWRRL